jgi:hypothetical protein
MRTFEVSKVELAAKPRVQLERSKAIADLPSVPALKDLSVKPDLSMRPIRDPRVSRIEQTYASEARLVACTDVNPLVQMAHDAFYEHRPITLSPDVVWFTIAQGFATHVDLNAEALRARVRHPADHTARYAGRLAIRTPARTDAVRVRPRQLDVGALARARSHRRHRGGCR